MTNLNAEMEELLCETLPIEKYRNSTFLITGATGLIGSLLVKSLLFLNDYYNLGLTVIAGVRNMEKAKSIYMGDSENGFLQITTIDLGKQGISFDGPVDYIIHTASVTSSKKMITNPIETIRTMVMGTDEVLKLALRKGVKAMVYISSMEMYGDIATNKKATEKDLGYIDLSNIRSCYPESKRLTEMLCNAYAYECGLNVKSVRLAQTIGAGVLPTENRVFAQFARCVIEKKDIVLHTEGKSEGNYIYTLDAISGILTVLTEGEKGNAYNVANEECHMTIRDMAELVASLSKDNHISVRVEAPKERMGYAQDVRLWLDNSKIRKLGWNASVGMREAYSRMIRYMINDCEAER